jgi:hypothetical protein
MSPGTAAASSAPVIEGMLTDPAATDVTIPHPDLAALPEPLRRRLPPGAHRPTAVGLRTRVVDRLVIHGAPLEFPELCRRAIPEETRYLILDLDRTLHLQRNMGELLGWELCARDGYGRDRLAAVEHRRRPGRFFLDWTRPAALLRYLLIGARTWAYPGLFYLLFGKIAGRFDLSRRWSFRTLGLDPLAAAQRLPQTALLRYMAGATAEELRLLARRVWDRHGDDQVIEREDLAWLRARCPRLRIVISSASPEPTLAVAAENLAVDDVVCSTVEEHEGRVSAPYWAAPSRRARGAAAHVSPPSRTRINSSRAKIEALLARYPDLEDPAVVSVGITDTDRGEDHCWADHFTRVVDVNSSAPFPPIVRAASPLREIHSAALLTRRERGGGGSRDPRRPPRAWRDRVFSGAELLARLAGAAELVEELAVQADEIAARLDQARRSVREQIQAVTEGLESLVRTLNDASGDAHQAAAEELRRELRRERGLRRALVRAERPLASLACARAKILASSRAALAAP